MAETTNLNPEEEQVFDPLDMNNYKVEKLPKMEKSGFEKWMARLGGPLAILVFVLIYWVLDIPFLNDITEESLTGAKAIKRLGEVGLADFIRSNYAMLAIFAAAIVLWVSEAIPNYLTSLMLILGVVLMNVMPQKEAFAQLGHPVMWLNILSFVLASMLVKTRVAKRFALWFVLRFGKNASGIFFSFIIINLVLSMFISATTVKATILLPIFMVVAAIYGASNGERNNFGRNLVLQNLFQVNIGASGFMTGSGANLLAVSIIAGAVGGYSISYSDWLSAALPLALLLLFLGWFVGVKVIFPLKKEEQKPQIEGGMERLRQELKAMGKVSFDEIKAVLVFVGVLLLWVTKNWHGIDETTVAFIGAVVALMPGIGIVKWNDVDIPWHLMLFSAGAYVLGSGLNATDLHVTLVDTVFDSLGITDNTPYWVLYIVLTGLMLLSALLFSSKNMRTMIFVPIAIATAQRFGYPIMSLAFPVALLIEHVYVLPFNSKPAALLYTTNHYSWSDTFKFGITMMMIAWVMIIIWGETVLQWLGFTPGLF
ncbi:MAG: DASS family sodium-coupled anion symporter [Rikenellaceae bacterium]|nr:DASS family sodium-coupled anion symporter [Rikenellaceae bacterium]